MTSSTNRAIFLDRDGVVNRAMVRDGRPYPPSGVDELEILPRVQEALRMFREEGFKIIIITNQPDGSRSPESRGVVEAIHQRMLKALPIDGVKVCYHTDDDRCPCRKPKPGMLHEAAREWSLDLGECYMVGDRWRDIEAGKNAGCKTILIDRGYRERKSQDADAVVASLWEASRWVFQDIHPLKRLKVKIFADGADLDVVSEMARDPFIRGFTTNPTLMRKSGVSDYKEFAFRMLELVRDKPISFEVLSDDFLEMEKQAFEIASWGTNVYVKIPVTNTQGEFTGPLVRTLSSAGVQVNVTAVMTLGQVARVLASLSRDVKSTVSVFAGRIADTGRDPVPLMAEAVKMMRGYPLAELIWASSRELLNVFQADQAGCHIITATSDVLAKLPLVGKPLEEFSLETVRMFHRDAAAANYTIAYPLGPREAVKLFFIHGKETPGA